MNEKPAPSAPPLRVFYLEDNPLIVFHIEQMVEDLGHDYAGALDSFEALKAEFDSLQFDVALVDINLTDGATGPDAAAWLAEKGIPSIFVTGQEQMARDHEDVCIGVVTKPVMLEALRKQLDQVGEKSPAE